MIRGRLYRVLMRLVHRYDWHYAPFIGPFEDGATQRWCKWCGFRESYLKNSVTTKERGENADNHGNVPRKSALHF